MAAELVLHDNVERTLVDCYRFLKPSDVETKFRFWKRWAESEMKEALNAHNFSPEEITTVLSLDSREEFYISRIDEYSSDKKCLVWALLGRAHSSRVKYLYLGSNDDSRRRFSRDEVIALFANLSSNTKVEMVVLTNQWHISYEGKFLGDVLKTNATLRELHLDLLEAVSAVNFLREGLQHNEVLDTLVIRCWLVSDALVIPYVSKLAEILQTNTTLKQFTVRFNDGLVMHLSLLDPTGDEPRRSLTFERMESPGFSIDVMISLTERNKLLSELTVLKSALCLEDWVTFVAALHENDTIKTLSLVDCVGLSQEVFQALMQLVQSGHTVLEEVDLHQSDLSMYAGQINEELRINKEYRSKLSGQTDLVQPKSGRLVMCGFEFGGKTTLCKTMVRVGHRQNMSTSERWKMAWDNFVKQFPRVRVFLFGRNILRELKQRTRGLDVVTISDEQSQRFFAWDFAGQKEYYALHDYMFPHVQNSCFLYVCNPTYKSYQDCNESLHTRMSEQVLFWMRFIASNCKPIQGRQLPIVHFVLTNKDRLDSNSLYIHTQWAVGVVVELKETFKDKIDLREPLVVNALSYEDVLTLLPVVKDSLQELLLEPTEYSVCAYVRHILESWAKGNGRFKPILRMRDFEKMVDREFRPDIREAVLAYLNDVGEIIFVKSMDFIVVSPRWFGVGILGPLVNAVRGVEMCGQEWKGVIGCLSNPDIPGGLHHRNGFVERKQVDYLLKVSLNNMDLTDNITREELIKLIIHLEMAFEESDGSRLFVPAVFDDPEELAAKGQRELHWTDDDQFRSGDIYVGRRLQCEDDMLTFLTPGFFPRFQVILRNYLYKKTWTENAGFQVGRNLIGFIEEDIEVLVEYNPTNSFVDILVKSFQSFQKTLEFVQEHVVSNILTFCASPRGCQGVQLVEAVIRPVCVEKLYRCDLRKDHAVKVSNLRSRIEQYGMGSKHTWNKPIQNVPRSDVALVLLEGDLTWKKREMFMADQLEDQEVQGPHLTSMRLHPPSDMSWQILADFPRSFYATIKDISTISRLSTKGNQILAKVVPINLHLLCDDGKGKKHMVDGQQGRLLKLNSRAGNNLPLMKLAISILWTGLKVGATTVGVSTFPTSTIDTWINSLFEVPEMDISSVDLVKYLGCGGPIVKQKTISEESILNALNRYLKLDPCTRWLKGFLDLQNSVKFKEDFKMRKVKYTVGSSSSPKFGWLCESCYFKGLKEGVLQDGSD